MLKNSKFECYLFKQNRNQNIKGPITLYICNIHVYCLPPLLQLSHITIIPLCSNIAHKELPPYTKMCYEAEISVLKQGNFFNDLIQYSRDYYNEVARCLQD